MRPGKKAYYRQFSVLVVLVSLSILTCCTGIVPRALHTLLFISAIAHFLLFWAGYFMGIGPLKKLKQGMLKDHENELKELGDKKRPWE